jgi:hypothetical protein
MTQGALSPTTLARFYRRLEDEKIIRVAVSPKIGISLYVFF